MAKVLFLLIAVTIFAGSNADQSRSLDGLLEICERIERSSNSLKQEIQQRIQQLEQLKEQGRALSNRGCTNTINTNIQKVMNVVNDRSREVSRLERDVQQTRDYVNGIRVNPRNHAYNTEILNNKEKKLTADMDLVYKLNNHFVPDASILPADFIAIQDCLKNKH